jgi:hypothetical protein
MANNPKKSQDPTEVALTAIQDALEIRGGEPRKGLVAQREPSDDDLFVDPPAAPARDERPGRAANLPANDDRANIGHVLQSLQRRPTRTPYVMAALFSAAWVVCALGLAYGYEGAFATLMARGATAAPVVFGLVAGFFAPIVFVFVLALMLARSQELRLISQSMAQIAVRLAEPETIAHESVVSIGQAVRREVAAMGDGVERALARAAELEALVNNEVTALERAYNDNELRVRTLLDGLASQRESLVAQAEQVRTAITNVHRDLSHDINSVSETVADRVNEAAQRIARSLSEKGEHIKSALDQAGGSMVDSLSDRGGELLDRLERTSRETTAAIETATDRLTSSLNFKTDHVSEEFVEIATNIQQMMSSRFDRVADGFAQKSASIVDLMETRSRALTQTIVETSSHIAETIATRAEEVNSTLKSTGDSIVLDLSLRGGDIVSKLEQTGVNITDTMIAKSDKVTQAFRESGEALAGTIGARGEAVHEMLSQRLQAFEEMFRQGGAELAERIGRDSSTLGNLVTRHITEFDRTVRTYGGELVERLGQRTQDLQEAMKTYLDGFDGRVSSKALEITTSLDSRLGRFQEALDSRSQSLNDALSTHVMEIAKSVADGGKEIVGALDKRIVDATETMSARGQQLTDTLDARINDVDKALGARATQVADTIETRIGRFEELLLGRAETVTREIETRSKTAADLLNSRMELLSQSVKTNTTEAVQALQGVTHAVTSAANASSASMRAAAGEVERSLTSVSTGVTTVLKQNAGEVERTLLGVGSEVARNLVARADEIAAAVGRRSGELTKVLDDKSGTLLAGISAKAEEIAGHIGRVTDTALQSIQSKALSFTGTMLDNSSELARIINDAGVHAAENVNRTMKELHDKTHAAVEQSRQVASVTVAEILETHGMLRSDGTTMFERLREGTVLLRQVLSGAQDNLGSIEHLLSTRVTEFVATMNQLLERTDGTTSKMDEHIGSFYVLTGKTLDDLTTLAVKFDSHGRALAQAAESVEASNRRTDESIESRRASIESLVSGLDTRTADIDARLRRFSGLLDESLQAAEARARDIARLVADATADGTRAVAEHHEAVRLSVEQERVRTGDSLRAVYEQATSEAHMLFRENAAQAQNMLQQAKDRFADTVSGLKHMASEMQRELEATRQELRRGILELPQETAESASQMRRVIVDQIEALAELNRIVARHGRGMDAQQPDSARRAPPEESVVVSMGGRGTRPAARTDITGSPVPPTPPPTAFAPRRAEAPSLSPSAPSGPTFSGGRGSSGWLTDLLSRASREDMPRADDRPSLRPDDRAMRPDDRSARNTIESLDSLSVDIARMIDHAAATDLWDRYNRGERNVFTKRLYTLQGQKAFDEISKRYRADREFKQTVDRYIGEFERLLEEVSRDDRGQVVARTYLTSETGKVYTMLAHAAGRFD